MPIIILISIILLILGIIFILINNNITKKNKQLYSNCIATTNATLDKYIERESTWSDAYATSYHPIYKYVIDNNEYTYNGFGDSKKIAVENIVIHYNPNNPSESYIEEETKKYDKLKNIFLKIGILLIFLAAILFINA